MENDNRMYRGEAEMSLLEEVEKLRNAPLPDVRVSVANKVSEFFSESVFDKFESKLACEILRLLTRDVEVRVRKTLSENLKSNTSIPRDIALTLAHDVLEVSTPILESCTLLTDEDLVEIVNSAEEVTKLEIIAKRTKVSEPVSGAIIARKQSKVIGTLLGNSGASISEADLQILVNQYSKENSIVEKLVFRGDLPISIVMKVMEFVSENLKNQLKSKYKIDSNTADEIADKSLEKATLGVLQQSTVSNSVQESPSSAQALFSESEQGVPKLEKMVDPLLMKKTKELVEYLKKTDKLTSSIVLRSLCEGNLPFFEVGLSRLAGIPIMNAHMLVWASNPTAFHSLYKRAEMPMSTLQAVELILLFMKQESVTELSSNGSKSIIRQRVVERILSGGYDNSVPLMPYFMTLINSKITTKDILN